MDWNKVKNVFITHCHTDHITGMLWVIRKVATMIKAGKYQGNLTIYGHDEVIHAIEEMCKVTLLKKQMNDQICFQIVENGENVMIGNYPVTFFDIHSTKAKQFGFCTQLQNNKKLCCIGDEPYHAECEKYVKKSDWLLCEAFCLYQEREIYKPYQKHHSTVKEAGEIAEQLEVKNLVLWHTEDDHVDKKMLYQKEAEEYFSGNIYVPNDFDKIELI